MRRLGLDVLGRGMRGERVHAGLREDLQRARRKLFRRLIFFILASSQMSTAACLCECHQAFCGPKQLDQAETTFVCRACRCLYDTSKASCTHDRQRRRASGQVECCLCEETLQLGDVRPERVSIYEGFSPDGFLGLLKGCEEALAMDHDFECDTRG